MGEIGGAKMTINHQNFPFLSKTYPKLATFAPLLPLFKMGACIFLHKKVITQKKRNNANPIVILRKIVRPLHKSNQAPYKIGISLDFSGEMGVK